MSCVDYSQCNHVWCTNGDWEYCSRCSINRRKVIVPEPCGHWWNTDCGEHDICRLCGAMRKNNSGQHQFSEDRVQATLDRIERQQATLLFNLYSGETRLMHSLKDLTDALKDLGTTIPDYIAKRDGIDADLRKQITDLQAGGALDAQAIEDAFNAAVADKALIAPPAVPVPDPAPADPIPVVDAGTVSETPAS